MERYANSACPFLSESCVANEAKLSTFRSSLAVVGGGAWARTLVVRQYAYAHSTLLTWALMGLCAVGMDIVELALWVGRGMVRMVGRFYVPSVRKMDPGRCTDTYLLIIW
jgi:hypothetical protein